ncbi:MAG: hypothetical protein ACYCZX_15730 [Rhodospirillaceae bacterium]
MTVTFQRALERISEDANGNVRADSSFRIDPDPRWQNVLHGKLKNGAIMITDADDVRMLGDPLGIAELVVSQTHLRMTLNKDGTVEGVLGGYVPWRSIYYFYSSSGTQEELMLGTNVPGAFYALRRHADAYPDPKTGENMAISAAFRVVAVPAFLISMAPKVEAKN